MVLSAAMAPEILQQNGDPKSSYGSVDIPTLSDDMRNSPSSEGTWYSSSDARLHGQLVRDQLEKVSKNQDPASFVTMLRRLLNPNSVEKFDEQKIFIVLHTLSTEIEKLNKNALTNVISSLVEFEGWSQVSPRITGAYLQFYKVLISGNPKWWVEIAKHTVMQFSDPRLDLAPHHAVIREILHIVPTSSAAFVGIFASSFPHKSSSNAEITNYISNLLEVVQYAPEQLHSVWELIIQRLVELDVECDDADTSSRKNEELDSSASESESGDDSLSDSDSDLDSDSSESSSDYDDDSEQSGDEDSISEAEDDDTASSVSGKRKSNEYIGNGDDFIENKRMRIENMDEGEEATAVELDVSMAQEPMSAKVDSVMSLLLSHLSTKFTYDSVVSGESTPLFKVLLQVFRDIVLPTASTQSVQFLWFFATHAHRDLMAAYLSLLLEAAMSTENTYDLRSRAMQYVASYVARAKGLSRAQVVFVVNFLADWVQRFIKEREVEVDESNSMASFRMFYAAIQALFYIFVFRHSMLRVESDEISHGKWEAGLDKLFQQAVNTKFNPLQYCQPQIVAMFARIAQSEEVASCYSIIERNRWGKFRSSSKSEDSNASRNSSFANGLFANNRDCKLYDSYLPFEPLRLRKTKRNFADIYEKWSEHDVTDSDTERELELERGHYKDEDEEDDFYSISE